MEPTQPVRVITNINMHNDLLFTFIERLHSLEFTSLHEVAGKRQHISQTFDSLRDTL